MLVFRVEFEGREYDWLGSDEEGCVALFMSAGGGRLPPQFVVAHDDAVRALLGSGPGASDGAEATRRGLYAYDADPNGGPYRRVASPTTPRPRVELPVGVRELVVQLPVRFRETRTM